MMFAKKNASHKHTRVTYAPNISDRVGTQSQIASRYTNTLHKHPQVTQALALAITMQKLDPPFVSKANVYSTVLIHFQSLSDMNSPPDER